MKRLCQEGLAANAFIDPPHLPLSVYAYGPDGLARERLVGHNTNVMGYPFLEGTWAVSSLSFLFLFLSILALEHLFYQPFLQNSTYCLGASGACLACRKRQARAN